MYMCKVNYVSYLVIYVIYEARPPARASERASERAKGGARRATEKQVRDARRATPPAGAIRLRPPMGHLVFRDRACELVVACKGGLMYML